MKFIIPQTKKMTREVIKEEFFPKYYPEMKVREGWWYIYGRYILLQKNPFVCAKFTVSQKDSKEKTQIRIKKDQNIWAYIIGAPIIGRFIQGDFYDELYRNFSGWLVKKYNLSKDDIYLTDPLAHIRQIINCMIYAAFVVGLLLFAADLLIGWQWYENPTPWQNFLMNIPTGRRDRDIPYIMLIFGIIFGIIYYFMKRKYKEQNAKIEMLTGVKIQLEKLSKKSILIISHIISITLFLSILVIAVASLSDSIFLISFAILFLTIVVDLILITQWLFKFKILGTTIVACLNIMLLVCLGISFALLIWNMHASIDNNTYNALFTFTYFVFILSIATILSDLICYILKRNGRIARPEEQCTSADDEATIFND